MVFLFLGLIFFEPSIRKAHRSLLRTYTNIDPQVIKSIYFCVSDLCLVGGLLYLLLFSRLFKNQERFPLFWIALTSLSLLTSTLHGPIPSNLFHGTHLFFWLACFSAYLLVRFWIQKEGEVLVTICRCLSIFSCFQAVVALFQYFSKGYVGLHILGELKGDFPGSLPLIQAIWQGIFDWIRQWGGDRATTFFRTAGTFDHPNILAGFLVCGILASFVCWELSSRKGVHFLGIFLQIGALFTTFSRAGLLVLLVTSAIFCGFRKRTLLMGTYLLFCFLFFTYSFLPEIRARGGIVNHNTVSHHSNQERMVAMKNAVWMIIKRPVWGLGVGNFSSVSERETGNLTQVHNIYLLLIAEFGIVGASLLGGLFFFSFLSGWNGREDSATFGLLMIFTALCLLGLFDFYPIVSHKMRLFFFALPACLCKEHVALSKLQLHPRKQGVAEIGDVHIS